MSTELWEAMQPALEPEAATGSVEGTSNFVEMRAQLSIAVSLKRIADALERSNRMQAEEINKQRHCS